MHRMSVKQGLAFLAAVGVTVPAAAQTTASNLPPYENAPTWTGFYVGAAFGAGAMANRVDTTIAGAPLTLDRSL